MLVIVNYYVVEKKFWERVNNFDVTKKNLMFVFKNENKVIRNFEL